MRTVRVQRPTPFERATLHAVVHCPGHLAVGGRRSWRDCSHLASGASTGTGTERLASRSRWQPGTGNNTGSHWTSSIATQPGHRDSLSAKLKVTAWSNNATVMPLPIGTGSAESGGSSLRGVKRSLRMTSIVLTSADVGPGPDLGQPEPETPQLALKSTGNTAGGTATGTASSFRHQRRASLAVRLVQVRPGSAGNLEPTGTGTELDSGVQAVQTPALGSAPSL